MAGAPPPPDLLGELTSLVESAGAVVAGSETFRVDAENPAILLGSGQLERLRVQAASTGANLVVFQNLLRPKQQENLEKALEVKVLDRREVILDIFARRARTKEGKLQVELAQLSFRLGRLAGGRKELSRLGGGIGTRGPGEKKLEVDRRRIRQSLRHLKDELETVRRTRSLHYLHRRETGIPVVALVGYTNAGKSTLFNRLTGSAVYAADQLFATLDPTARSFRLPSGKEAILVDTVGFIHELPDELRDAFMATLEGIGEADALVHVADLSSPSMDENMASVENILGKLSCSGKPSVTAFNKCDAAGAGASALREGFPVSARTGEGTAALLSEIERILCASASAGNDSTPPE